MTEEQTWYCVWCGKKNPGWAKRQCLNCGVCRDLAEFKDTFTLREAQVLTLAAKIELEANSEAVQVIVRESGMEPWVVEEIVQSLMSKLGELDDNEPIHIKAQELGWFEAEFNVFR